MADEIDMANLLMDNEISAAINRIRKSTAPNAQAMAIKECLECGEDIPEARKQLGFSLCVACAQESERRRSLYADEY